MAFTLYFIKEFCSDGANLPHIVEELGAYTDYTLISRALDVYKEKYNKSNRTLVIYHKEFEQDIPLGSEVYYMISKSVYSSTTLTAHVGIYPNKETLKNTKIYRDFENNGDIDHNIIKSIKLYKGDLDGIPDFLINRSRKLANPQLS